MRPLFLRRCAPIVSTRRQRGVVLMVALIALVALTLAGLSMVRTADTGSVIAGNMSLRQAALQATDPGVEGAFTQLSAAGGIAASLAVANATQANNYYPLIQSVDAQTGLPSGVDWTAAPQVGGVPSGYDVRYVIERMCFAIPATTDEIETKCIADKLPSTNPTTEDPVVFPDRYKVNYRVTIRVLGPRNALSVAQAMITY